MNHVKELYSGGFAVTEKNGSSDTRKSETVYYLMIFLDELVSDSELKLSVKDFFSKFGEI